MRRALLGPGAFLGQDALGPERSATPAIRTVTPTTPLVLTRSAWEGLTTEEPAGPTAITAVGLLLICAILGPLLLAVAMLPGRSSGAGAA